MDKVLRSDVLQWDVTNWSIALRFWQKRIDWQKVNTCLELGSNKGGLSLWLALKGKKVICSDINNTEENASQLHKKYNVKNITYHDVDATNIPYENYFDVIVFKSILGGIGRENQIEQQQKVITEIHKALKKGGHLLFAENLASSPLHQYLRKRFNAWSDTWHYVTPQEMAQLLNDFSSFELRTTGFFGALGRGERQKKLFSYLDKFIVSWLVPRKWRYIVYGVATK